MNNSQIDNDKQKQEIKSLSKNLRDWRKIHHYVGLIIASLLFISATTGILLGWKKDLDIIQPRTYKGEASNLSEWLSLEKIQNIATQKIKKKAPEALIDRMDVRPDKGIVKVLFMPGYWEIQIDGKTGSILSSEKRYSDLIEQIHDGSIINDSFKLLSMNIFGFSLIILIISGLWLWYGPKRIRKLKS